MHEIITIWRQNINMLKLKEWRSLSLKVFFNFWRKKMTFAIFRCCSEWPSAKKRHFKSRSKFCFWLTQKRKSKRNRERYALFVVELTRWKYRNIEIKKKPLLSARKRFFFYFIHFMEKKKYYFTSLYSDPRNCCFSY